MAKLAWVVVLVAAEAGYQATIARAMPLGHARLAAVLYGGVLLAVASSFVAIKATDATVGWAMLLAAAPLVVMTVALVRTAIGIGILKAEDDSTP